MQFSAPKGTFDILPEEPNPEDAWKASHRWQHIEEIMRKTAHDFGFTEIRTPIFESSDLFIRGVGDTSDIVTKEMYTFLDKSGRSLTLRPEVTAPIIRAFLENRLYQHGTVHKFFSIGPMFRYERPQAGRYRQLHQFDVEAIGVKQPEQDVELIDMLYTLYAKFGLTDIKIALNSVGDPSSRAAFRSAITSYLEPHFAELSPESQVRFSKNPLRILDSKDSNDQKILEGAPVLLDFIEEEPRAHFDKILALLKRRGIPFSVDPKLVRGLDYYNRTVFEVIREELGAQNAICGGGRYDGLVKTLGGPDLPTAGFAIGMERLLQTLAKQERCFPPGPHPLLYIAPIGEAARTFCFDLVCHLRHEGIAAEMELQGKKIPAALSQASALNANYFLAVGDDELASKSFQLKHLKDRSTIPVTFDNLVSFLMSHQA